MTRANINSSRAPLVVHVIYQLDVGGLQNGLVNLINHMPPDRYRHAIICLADYMEFSARIKQPVELFALHKRDGKDLGLHRRIWQLLRHLRPAIVHTRNLTALEAQLPALLAGVKRRVHSEHGREGVDLGGKYLKYNLFRRAFKPLVHKYIALSRDLESWLQEQIRIPEKKLNQIYNGVDTDRFYPYKGERNSLPVASFAETGSIVVGTVGRLAAVKDQLTLVRAFTELLEHSHHRSRLRLVLIGDGPLLPEIEKLLQKKAATEFVWLARSRNDVPELLRSLDIFVLPSLGEGISNTILEAMASGLPVIATDVGGNAELVIDGETGILVPAADPSAMVNAIQYYVDHPNVRRQHGLAGRTRVETIFSMHSMVESYMDVYDSLLKSIG